MAEREVNSLQIDMKNLEEQRKRLSDFFCEDSTSFKLEECFKVFHGFCTRFRQAIVDNARRKIQEEQANARRKQREEMAAAKKKQSKNLINILTFKRFTIFFLISGQFDKHSCVRFRRIVSRYYVFR